jgi:hypothetical protein
MWRRVLGNHPSAVLECRPPGYRLAGRRLDQ